MPETEEEARRDRRARRRPRRWRRAVVRARRRRRRPAARRPRRPCRGRRRRGRRPRPRPRRSPPSSPAKRPRRPRTTRRLTAGRLIRGRPTAGRPRHARRPRPPADPRTGRRENRSTNRHGGHLGGAGQGAARADRRRVHGLQARPDEADGDLDKAIVAPARAGPRRGRQEVRPRRPRGPRLELHPHRRPRRRAHRGQLRDRLRGPHRRVPEARPRPRDPGRRARARCTSTRSAIPADVLAAKQAELLADESVQKKPENIRAADRRGPAQEVVLAGLPLRAAVPRRGADRRASSITEKIATIGENIRVRRFTRYALGEEL